MPPFGGSPYSPGAEDRYDYRPGSAITDLILRAGDVRAQQQMRSGDIWGQTVAGLGQMAGGAIQDYQAQKAAEAKARAEQEQKAQMGQFATATMSKGFNFEEEIQKLPRELQPEAIQFFQTQEKSKAEVAKAKAEMEAKESYRLADAAYRLKQSIGTPYEGIARETMGRFFADDYPEQAGQLTQLPPDQLMPVLDGIIGGSQEFQKQQAEIEAKRAEPGLKEREFQERQRATNLQAETTRRGQDLDAAQAAAARAVQLRGQDLSARQNVASSDQDASFLLQGGTADKLPQAVRTTAVEAARKSGGVDGTGFVPNNAQQQTKYSDLMDLWNRANKLERLLEDPEVQKELGPVAGLITGKTKEGVLGFGGASTKVKAAFDLLKNFSDTELRNRTGAATSPGEYDRITGFTVSELKQPDSNLTNLRGMKEEIKRGLNIIGASKLPELPKPDKIRDPNWGANP